MWIARMIFTYAENPLEKRWRRFLKLKMSYKERSLVNSECLKQSKSSSQKREMSRFEHLEGSMGLLD